MQTRLTPSDARPPSLAPSAAARWLCGLILLLLTLVAGLAHGAPVDVKAEIIWDDSDAQGKCPKLCMARDLDWTGNWRKTTDWVPSYVCSCDERNASRPIFSPGRPPPAPELPQNVRPQQQFLPGGSVVRYDYIDFHDAQDLRNGPAQSFEQCAGVCLADGQCGAFTFAADQQRCYLKGGAGNLQRAQSAFSGMVASRGPVGGGVPGLPPPPAQGGSCSIASTQKCPGCSVACAAGQTPTCTNAVEGVTSWCARNAACTCK